LFLFAGRREHDGSRTERSVAGLMKLESWIGRAGKKSGELLMALRFAGRRRTKRVRFAAVSAFHEILPYYGGT